MGKVYLSYNNIISPLGSNSASVIDAVQQGRSGLKRINDPRLSPNPFYGARISSEELKDHKSIPSPSKSYTRLETLMIASIDSVLKASNLELTDRVGLFIATTKGNIDVLDKAHPFSEDRAYLNTLGKVIQHHFKFSNEALLVSNACVSGLLAVVMAKRYIDLGVYDHVIVTGGDVLSKFVLSGFSAFQAMSHEQCKPYDLNRSGINIGEAIASLLVTKDTQLLSDEAVQILGGGSCNDANHISGPSRTGEGLYRSVQSAMKEAKIQTEEIDYIAAHGTATLFNDEMEAVAFDRLGMNLIPLNSLKGYFGHTMGASGLVETIVGMHSLHRNTLFASLGFESIGVSKPIHVIPETKQVPLTTFLKTSSGFGGCNTAAIFQKIKEN